MNPTRLLISLLFIPITAWTVNAQTSTEMRVRLGIPVAEVFRPGKGISVTNAYDAKGQICDVRIVGEYNKIEQLADKVVPVKERGRLFGPPMRFIPVLDCCEGWAYQYERVTMKRYFGNSQDYIEFIFKGRACLDPRRFERTRR